MKQKYIYLYFGYFAQMFLPRMNYENPRACDCLQSFAFAHLSVYW